MKTVMANAGVPVNRTRRRHWLRYALATVVVLAALIAVLGFVVVPRVAKAKIEAFAQADLGRHATIGQVAFNPFTLRARMTDFRLADRDSSRTLFAFGGLDVRISPESLWKLAPIIDSVTLTRPEVNLVRGDDGQLDIRDLVERSGPGSAAPISAFSIDNIEIVDGTLTFDDRVHGRVIRITGLGIGIPFLSSFPHDATIRVTPHVEGTVDGSRFSLSGSTNAPFSDVHAAILDLDFEALKLADYASYFDSPEGLKLASGSLTTKLKLAFVTGPSGPRTITLSGSARVDQLEIERRDGTALAGMKSLAVDLAGADLVGHVIAIDRVSVDAPRVDLRRDSDGRLEIERLLEGFGDTSVREGDRGSTAPSDHGSSSPVAATAAPPGWTLTASKVALRGGSVAWTDASTSPVFHAEMTNVAFDAVDLANKVKGGEVKLTLDSSLAQHVTAEATLDVPHAALRGSFAVSKLAIALLAPYYASAVDIDVRRGTVDAAGAFDLVASKSPPDLTLKDGRVALDGVVAALRGERAPSLTMTHAEAGGIAIDGSKRSVTVDAVAWRGGALRATRLPGGMLDLERAVSAQASPARGDASPASPAGGGQWTVEVGRAEVGNVIADFDDRALRTPAHLHIVAEHVTAEDIGTGGDGHARVDATLRVGKAGKVRAAGGLTLDPLRADLRVDATGIDLVTFVPYVEGRTNVVVTRGTASAKGTLTVALPAAGPAPATGAMRATWKGDLGVTDFDSVDRPGNQELLRWKRLALTGADIVTEPLAVGLGSVSLDDFYARIILNADATLNLQQLLAAQPAAGSIDAKAVSPNPGGASAPLPASPVSGTALPVSIAGIRLSNGEVEYSDFFVKPNYQTHLTGVAGTVSALSANLAGNVSLAAKVQGNAPVSIHGTINPFASDLQLDLTATANDVELPPLTPYSIKYAGYGIEKGKLSMEVHYRIDDRKLTASNKLRLDQLTFGSHVDSPTATKLPVLLAVSLLKDRNGVINLDLPIEGTLDDPKFSIGRVIVQVLVNLITKAVTAPFALLGAIAGGSHEDLSWVGFAPGHADLAKPALARLETLAKALADRPGLRLEIAGRAVPDLDRDALKHLRLERAMRVRKQKDLAAEGRSAPPIDEITIGPAEQPKYLAEVYRDATISDKPKNFLGVAKEIPPAEMESMLLATYTIDDSALVALANERAGAVKAWLIGPGKVAPGQVFVVAPKLGTGGIADKGEPTRVDFALR